MYHKIHISIYLSMNTVSHPSPCTMTPAVVTILGDREEELTKNITSDTYILRMEGKV